MDREKHASLVQHVLVAAMKWLSAHAPVAVAATEIVVYTHIERERESNMHCSSACTGSFDIGL